MIENFIDELREKNNQNESKTTSIQTTNSYQLYFNAKKNIYKIMQMRMKIFSTTPFLLI